jgi:hypothetical protein
MSSPLNGLLKLSASILETGIMAVTAGARTLQEGIETLAAPKSNGWQKEAPINGPTTVDGALSDLGNHLMRIGMRTRPEP